MHAFCRWIRAWIKATDINKHKEWQKRSSAFIGRHWKPKTSGVPSLIHRVGTNFSSLSIWDPANYWPTSCFFISRLKSHSSDCRDLWPKAHRTFSSKRHRTRGRWNDILDSLYKALKVILRPRFISKRNPQSAGFHDLPERTIRS